jgi:hypothetical protein
MPSNRIAEKEHAMTDQLEIIAPDGQIQFYDLDPVKGITNVGQHADNDIVLDAPHIAPFQAMIDHRQKPVRIVVYDEGAAAVLHGETLQANVPAEMANWDAVELDGYSLVLIEAEPEAPIPGAPGSRRSPSGGGLAQVPIVGADLRPRPTPDASPTVGAGLSPRPAEQRDELVVVEDLPEREWVVDPGQSATTRLTVVNGGPLVAWFEIRVEGLPAEWVALSDEVLKLNEGERGTVELTFSPTRVPSSRAGPYPFSVVVASPSYPGHASCLNATLHVGAFYAFSTGELTPKQQTVRWARRLGQAEIPVTNNGNSDTLFRVTGEDAERACHFEFRVPGEDAGLVRQAEIRIPPGATAVVPMSILPPRRLVALRGHPYAYTVTTAMVGGDQMPRSVMGQLKSAPLIGPLALVLIGLCLAFLLGFLFSPSRVPELRIDPRYVREPGGSVALDYAAARFPALGPDNLLNRVNRLFLRLALEYKAEGQEWQVLAASRNPDNPIEGTAGRESHVPPGNGYYRLTSKSWVSDLVAFLEGESGVVPVFVEPVEPQVTFTVDRNPILAGETVTLRWNVLYAESLVLEHEGIVENISPDMLQAGQYSAPLDLSTTYTLIATNRSWEQPVRATQQVEVLYPTPVVVRFDVAPLTIAQGDNVQISWEALDAEGVSIDPLGGFPIKGETSDQPPELRRYRFVAFKSVPDGSRVESQPLFKEVYVNTPTPTPAPPEIQVFDATPKEVIRGDDQLVNLRWQVTGQTTNVEITAPGISLPGLAPQDPDGIEVTVEETTLFILTAYNGELSVSAPVEVTIVEPTPTLTPTPTATPTATPVPPPLVTFLAEAVSGQVDWLETVDTGQGEKHIYQVEAGSDVRLKWAVQRADKLTLDGQEQVDIANGSVEVLDVTSPALHTLAAFNNEDANEVREFIQLDLFSPPPPRPPTGLSGELVAGSGITLTWRHHAQPGTATIDGFRVYRATVVPKSDFEPLQPPPDVITALEYVDPEAEGGTCGKAYYVVAVYQAIENNQWVEKETDASANSWYSPPCSP